MSLLFRDAGGSAVRSSAPSLLARTAPRRRIAQSSLRNQTSGKPAPLPIQGKKIKVPLPPRRPAPEQKWSNRTLVLMSTAVGSSMFMLGLNQGYSAGKRQAIEEFQLGKLPEASAAPVTALPGKAV